MISQLEHASAKTCQRKWEGSAVQQITEQSDKATPPAGETRHFSHPQLLRNLAELRGISAHPPRRMNSGSSLASETE